MARPLRINHIGGIYHVTSRGNARQDIFFNDEDRRRFTSQLRDNLETYQVQLHAGVLMTNHFHLLVRLHNPNLSKFMQRLLTSYAMYFRYKHKRPGHLFQGRFNAKLVEDESYLVRLSRYIHLNPIKTMDSQSLGDTDKLQFLRQYKWSTYPVYIGQSPRPEYLNLDVLKHFSDKRSQAHTIYQNYIYECILKDDEELRNALASSTYAIGSEKFVKSVESELSESRRQDSKDQDLNFPKTFVPIDQINQCVCEYYQVQPVELLRRGKIAGRVRRVAIELACRLSGLSQREIGQHYGGIRSQSVSKIRRQFRESVFPDEAKTNIQILVDRLRKVNTE
jgi:putative transposase